MAASSTKIVAADMSPFFRLFTDGTIERIPPPQATPPSDDPDSAVRSKDVVIDPKTGVSARIFAPRRRDPSHKLPLVVYIHGGAFCMGSPSSPPFHNFISNLVEKGNVIAVSVDYRLAPENPMPIPFDDSWAAFQWIIGHADGNGADPWLNECADFQRVFIGGESAGATIANDVAIRAGVEGFRFRDPESGGGPSDPANGGAARDILRGGEGFLEGQRKSLLRGFEEERVEWRSGDYGDPRRRPLLPFVQFQERESCGHN